MLLKLESYGFSSATVEMRDSIIAFEACILIAVAPRPRCDQAPYDLRRECAQQASCP
jgi:hypothetical protein